MMVIDPQSAGGKFIKVQHQVDGCTRIDQPADNCTGPATRVAARRTKCRRPVRKLEHVLQPDTKGRVGPIGDRRVEPGQDCIAAILPVGPVSWPGPDVPDAAGRAAHARTGRPDWVASRSNRDVSREESPGDRAVPGIRPGADINSTVVDAKLLLDLGGVELEHLRK